MSTVDSTVAVVEKEVRIALPEIAEADYKVIAFSTPETPVAGAAYIKVEDINEYAQVAAVAKSCEKVKIASTSKKALLVIDGSHPKNADKVALINEELKGKVVVIEIIYNGAERLRLSAKTMGTSIAKKSLRGSFFDRDLNGVVDMGEFNYIYGVEGTEYTKEENTKILRVVKSLLADGILYSDNDKSGFHKTNSRIPSDARTEDNYSWYFVWSDIAAKLTVEKVTARLAEDAKAEALKALVATLEGEAKTTAKLDDATIAKIEGEAATKALELNINSDEVIANIVKVINSVYPNAVIDTTKPLYLEGLKSVFAAIKSEKFVFNGETIVSLKAEAAAAKEAKKADREAKAEAKKAEKKAKKAEEANAETAEVVDAPIDVTPVGNETVAVTPVAVAPINVAPVAPINVAPVAVAPIAPVAPVINPAELIAGINPANN